MKETRPCSICSAPVTRYPSLFGFRVSCSPECKSKIQAMNKGKLNPDWKGGRYVEPGKGYILIRNPDHPRARANGYVLEHIVVMERKLGRPLAPGERVHHVDHNPANNHPRNLKVYASNGEHLREEGHCRKRQPPCRCGQVAVAKGLCSRHYAQKRRTGRTLDLD